MFTLCRLEKKVIKTPLANDSAETRNSNPGLRIRQQPPPYPPHQGWDWIYNVLSCTDYSGRVSSGKHIVGNVFDNHRPGSYFYVISNRDISYNNYICRY